MLADEQTVQPRHLRGSRMTADVQWLVSRCRRQNRAHEKKRKRQDAVRVRSRL